jgi:uncharacterized protein YndB with AHSA1/START domain
MKITVTTLAKCNLDTAWTCWSNPDDIVQWNAASADWHTTGSSVDLRVGGKFSARMEAKDGSAGFDFAGTYTRVVDRQLIEYVMDDARAVTIEFAQVEDHVRITETFDAETLHDAELQRQGWQSILDSFARYVEAKD